MHQRAHLALDLECYGDAQYVVEAFVNYALGKQRQEHESEVQELKDEIQELKDEIQGLKDEIQGLKVEMENLEGYDD